MFVGFKGAGKLGPRGLAALEELLQMRQKIAQQQNKPLFRIILNKSLLELAEKRPSNLNKLRKTEILGPKQIDRYGKNIVAAVTRALQVPAKNLPRYPRKTAPMVPAIVAKRVKELRIWRDRMAQQLKVDPAIICTKALISSIAVQKPATMSSLSKMKELKAWQVKEFGRDIINILNTVG